MIPEDCDRLSRWEDAFVERVVRVFGRQRLKGALLRRLRIEFRSFAKHIAEDSYERGGMKKTEEILRAIGAAPAVRHEPMPGRGRP